MKVFGWILLGVALIGVPIGMIWWNATQGERIGKTKGEYDTPILGRIFKN